MITDGSIMNQPVAIPIAPLFLTTEVDSLEHGVKTIPEKKELHGRIMEPKFVEPRMPRDIEVGDNKDFRLLAVAYGLAHPYPDIPKFRPPRGVAENPVLLEIAQHKFLISRPRRSCELTFRPHF
jgi:hypothetical protein